MKKLLFFSLILLLHSCNDISPAEIVKVTEKIDGIYLACSDSNSNSYKFPKETIVSGRILNSDILQKEIILSVYHPGRSNQVIRAKVDSLGNFSTYFKLYTPTDIEIDYNTSFLTLVHPGDSVYITFNGDLNNTTKLLKSVKYSGDAAKLNQDAARFQLLYYSNTFINDRAADEIAVKDLNAEDYLKFRDTIRSKARDMLKTFIDDITPEKEAILWASTYIEKDYYYALASYPIGHRYLNKISRKEWDVPTNYYDSLLNLLPIKKSMLISGYAVTGMINTIYYDYTRLHIFQDPEYEAIVSRYVDSPNLQEIKDSLLIWGIIKYTPDSLTRQLVLTEMIEQDFDMNEISKFEKNRKLIESYIKEPFLINPIIERYNITKERLAKPEIFSDEIFSKLRKSSVNKIIDSILNINKRKVIYIKFWATWCSPCIDEFSYLKEMMSRVEYKDVSFVFVCMDSKEKIWQQKIDELNIGGQHYFLSKKQSNDIHEILEFNGFPYYVLIDRNGELSDKGVNIIGYVRKGIDRLLAKND